MHKALVSVVIPCFNEEAVLPETLATLHIELSRIRTRFELDTELVIVDDGSTDRTLEILRAAAEHDPSVRVIPLSRNFGHQAAVAAGIEAATGDAVVMLDADLQDPPALIGDMVAAWRRGAKVVYGQRTSREALRIRYGLSFLYYRLLNRVSDIRIPPDAGDFRLLDRSVVDILLSLPERSLYVRGLSAWVGFEQEAIPYEREARHAGQSKYSWSRLVSLALDGVLSFSTAPLRWGFYVGLAVSGVAVLGIFGALIQWLVTDRWINGATANFIALLFFGGIQVLFLGIIGFYIARIHEDVKARPRYLVKEMPDPETLPPFESVRTAATSSACQHCGRGPSDAEPGLPSA